METLRSKIALVFPGQGSQFVGMGQELCREYPEARDVFARADETLGWSLSRLCFEGPAEMLNDTANTQPAIYTATYALWRALVGRTSFEMSGGVPAAVRYVAGHSLGEFSALAVAGAYRFEEGLRLVRCRGEAMRDSGAQAPGGMAVILGMDDAQVAAIVEEASDGERVWLANLNAPGQVVIAGEHEALQRALALATARKAKRAMALPVSVACHTPLMAPAAARLEEALAQVQIQKPLAAVVSNATAEPTCQPEEIRANLLKQLTRPVRWVESVRRMAADGVQGMLEIGPKEVVSGLVKRIDPTIALQAVTDLRSLEALRVEALVP